MYSSPWTDTKVRKENILDNSQVKAINLASTQLINLGYSVTTKNVVVKGNGTKITFIPLLTIKSKPDAENGWCTWQAPSAPEQTPSSPTTKPQQTQQLVCSFINKCLSFPFRRTIAKYWIQNKATDPSDMSNY